MDIKDERTYGYLLTTFSFLIWGLYPLFFKLYDPEVGSYEILIHRIIWSVFFLALVLYFFGGFCEVLTLLKDRQKRNALILSGSLIGLNWWAYVYAVNNNFLLQTGLGQFIAPLISIALGAIFLKESVSKVAKFAIAIVTIAIFVQIYALGEFPIYGLLNSFSFCFYSLIRKKENINAVPSLFVETMLLLPLSLMYFWFLIINENSNFKINFNGILMILSGLITVIPLLLFNIGATKIKLASIAFIQYIIPIMSICIGVYYGEELNLIKIVSFLLIVFAVVMVSVDGILRRLR